MAGKKFEMTGSPRPFFSKKDVFVEKMAEFGWEQCKMTKRNNQCQILITDDVTKSSNKMTLANDLDVVIMSYEDVVDAFDLEGDL